MLRSRILDAGTINSLLQKKTLTQLKEIAVQSGVTTSGLKSELTDRLAAHFISTHHRKPSTSILSFDLGYRNLGYCHLNQDATIVDWARIDLELPSYHASVVAPIVRQFLAKRVTPSLTTADTVLVEQQRARSNGSHSVLEHTLRVNSVESILWCGLDEVKEKYEESLLLTAVARRSVDRVWQPELDSIVLENEEQFKKIKKSTYYKKAATVLLVEKWIETDSVVKCSEELKDMFRAEKKKDDLSDSLLQALAWFRWEKYIQNYIDQNLLEGSSNN